MQVSETVAHFDIPDHVPPEMVLEWDWHSGPHMPLAQGGDPFSGIQDLRDKGQRIYYLPHDPYAGEGTWLPMAAEDIRRVMLEADIFSNKGSSGFARLIGETWDLLPLEVDPPDHQKYRSLLNPLFSPKAMAKMDGAIVGLANGLIDKVFEQGECDFMEAFGRPFPVQIFLELMGLPVSEYKMFMAWEEGLLHGASYDDRAAAAREIADYLRALIKERMTNPVDDLVSFVVQADIDGRKLTGDEIIGMCFLLFVGGLDTVASSLGHFFRHIASNPEQQEQLRSNPSLTPKAVEELLRRFSVVHSARRTTRDVELGGVQIKAGEVVACGMMMANLDPAEFAEPETVDFQRPQNRHVAFAYGAHHCLGSHLARRELAAAINVWLGRTRRLEIIPDRSLLVRGGTVFGVDEMWLRWTKP